MFAAVPITGTTPLCTSTPSGTPTIPASRPISVTEHTTIAMTCRGVMPTDLNTPRSCTRSRSWSTTVFSTPSPATTTSKMVSSAISVTTAIS